MPFALRVLLCSLALSIGFNDPILAPRRAPDSTRSPHQSSDEETVRALTEKYGLAITARDLETMRRLWNPQSPNLDSRIRFYQGQFLTTRTEFISLTVSRVDIRGDKAVSHLTTDERRLDDKTGAILSTRESSRGVCRSFEWVKNGSEWKIEREFVVQEELASRLEAATSERERDALLETEKYVVTDVLVSVLSNRGDRHAVRGNYDAAVRCYRLQEVVAERIGDQAGIAGAWLNIGLLKYSQGDYEQAMPHMQNALALFEAAKLKRGVAIALDNLSQLFRVLGDLRQAFYCGQKALRLYEEANHRKGTAASLSILADIYEAQNNSQQALAYLEKAIAIAQELGDKIRTATLRLKVANQHSNLGNHEQALEIYQELLKEIEGYGDRGGAAIIWALIGRVLAAQGRYAEALDYYNQALAELEASNQKVSIIAVLDDLSGLYLAQGKHAEALPLAERAVSMSRTTGAQLDLCLTLTSLGYSQLGLNRPSEARRSFAESVSIIEKLRGQTVGGAEDRQRYFEQGLGAHHGILNLLVKENQTQEALVFAERAKARVLLDALQQGQVSVQKTMTAEEREQEVRLKSELTRLNLQLTHATQSGKPEAVRIGEIKSRLETARLNFEAFQTSLYASHPELKVRRGAASIIKAEELTALLPDASSALLEYVVAVDQTYLFAITKAVDQAEAKVQVFTIPIKRAELAKQIESLRGLLAGRDLGFRGSARKLYDLLLKPAQGLLRGKSGLVIVPDDKLWELPFQALLSGEGRYLIESSSVSYVPSLTVLREMKAERGKHGAGRRGEQAGYSLLALGNPAIGEETIERAALTMRDEKLDQLPDAELEVKALRRLYGASRSKVYIGAEAREDRLKAEATQARVIHLATHGILNNASPMYSHLVLAQGDKAEDGLLEAWELMQMDLNADLAVLSACETARGRFGAGEGVIGLSWALFVAGVPSTVVSQWKVESASARALTLNFHRQLRTPIAPAKGSATKAEALRLAALKLMRNPQTSHPFYWAGFVLVGDGG